MFTSFKSPYLPAEDALRNKYGRELSVQPSVTCLDLSRKVGVWDPSPLTPEVADLQLQIQSLPDDFGFLPPWSTLIRIGD